MFRSAALLVAGDLVYDLAEVVGKIWSMVALSVDWSRLVDGLGWCHWMRCSLCFFQNWSRIGRTSLVCRVLFLFCMEVSFDLLFACVCPNRLLAVVH